MISGRMPGRNADYVFTAPVPFAPMTRVGLRVMAYTCADDLTAMEAMDTLSSRPFRGHVQRPIRRHPAVDAETTDTEGRA